ncbi:MAG: threonine-phosphate decarboxylase CobD [Rhizobiaceae bacterium]
MQPDKRAASPITDHGGNLAAARLRFRDAPEPWIDLSTGISPFPYPHSPLPATAFSRLPEPGQEKQLRETAAQAYGAPSADNVAAAPGTQLLLPFVFSLRKPGRAVVLGPTYAEHGRVAALCGHECEETGDAGDLAGADLAVVVNPNNPDGRVLSRGDLVSLAHDIAARGGLLVVDEAFMDVGAEETSLCGDVNELPIVVLRSFGKFHGLAGIRLGFAIARGDIAGRLREQLGPWAVSGPAMAIGAEALADADWRASTRDRLAAAAKRLGALLEGHRLESVGGTNLFQLVRHPEAQRLCELLGQNGILVRSFSGRPTLLRFGLPDNDAAWGRLEQVLIL